MTPFMFHVECLPSAMLDAVLLELLLAPLHILFLAISIFTLPLFAFLVLLMLLYLTITVNSA